MLPAILLLQPRIRRSVLPKGNVLLRGNKIFINGQHRLAIFFGEIMTASLYTENCTKRQHTPTKADNDYRSAYRRDYARLIHSPAFRRLQGKTQLYPGHESDFFRNRLTHSLEVAQIAKSIALKINHEIEYFKANPIDCDLVEFSALAHDLGHPPFGHNGERALDDCMKQWGGFEGNAQTLRILAATEKKETKSGQLIGIEENGNDNRAGLNITFRGMASVLKYDNPIPNSRKNGEKLVKGYYQTEGNLVKEIKKNISPHLPKTQQFKTIECQIMDIADDIAYSTYDLEDGLKGGFVEPLSLLSKARGDIDLLDRVTKKVQKECPEVTQDNILEAIAGTFSLDIDGNSLAEQVDNTPLGNYAITKIISTDGYMRSAFTSALIDKYISAVKVEVSENYPALSKVIMDPVEKLKVETIKHLNYEVTIMSPRLKLVEYRGYEIVQTIFKSLTEEDGHLLLPQDVRDSHKKLKDSASKMRLICDFVAGMTDRYAIEFFSRLKQGDQSIFKPF